MSLGNHCEPGTARGPSPSGGRRTFVGTATGMHEPSYRRLGYNLKFPAPPNPGASRPSVQFWDRSNPPTSPQCANGFPRRSAFTAPPARSAGVTMVRRWRVPSVSPMGVNPHGSHTAAPPRSHRRVAGADPGVARGLGKGRASQVHFVATATSVVLARNARGALLLPLLLLPGLGPCYSRGEWTPLSATSITI
jgi:hypothetical protein